MNQIYKRRTEITIETHSVTIIRARSRSSSAFCERCQTETTAFALEQIAAICRMDLSEICRRIETDEFHLIGFNRSVGLICGSSLQNSDSPARSEK